MGGDGGGGGERQTDGPTDKDRQSVSDKCSPVCFGLTEKQSVSNKCSPFFSSFFRGGGAGFVPSLSLSLSLYRLIVCPLWRIYLTFCPVRED